MRNSKYYLFLTAFLMVTCCSLIICECFTDNHKQRILVDPENLSLCEIFRALRDTIPRKSLITLVAQHYNEDVHFREAVNFLNSTDFDAVSQAISATAKYQKFLGLFQVAGVNTQDINSVANIVKCLMVPLPTDVIVSPDVAREHFNKDNFADGDYYEYDYDHDYDLVVDVDTKVDDDEDEEHHSNKSKRISLTAVQTRLKPSKSFAHELLNLIPRPKFIQELNKYMRTNTQFSKFIDIARQSKFQHRLIFSLASAAFRKQMKILKQHYIDFKLLVVSILKPLAW